jgi:hypothetical protein
MTTKRKIAANRRNSSKSCGPRSAAGKSIASRNALRHGLAAIAHRRSAPLAEIAEFTGALCEDDNPTQFAQAIVIAENEAVLGAVRAQQVAAIERLREPYIVPFSRKDNSLKLAKGRVFSAWLAERELNARLPELLKKYKAKVAIVMENDEVALPKNEDRIVEWLIADGTIPEFLQCVLEELLEEPDPIDEQTRECARKQIEERDEYEALETAIGDLIRLDRYQRRAWSRQKRAIRDFMRIKVMHSADRAAPPRDTSNPGTSAMMEGSFLDGANADCSRRL